MSEKEELQEELQHCINQYRISVRWLRDVRFYRDTYVRETTYEGKSWKGDTDLSDDATRAYEEATATLLHWRRRVDACNEKLMDLAKNRGR